MTTKTKAKNERNDPNSSPRKLERKAYKDYNNSIIFFIYINQYLDDHRSLPKSLRSPVIQRSPPIFELLVSSQYIRETHTQVGWRLNCAITRLRKYTPERPATETTLLQIKKHLLIEENQGKSISVTSAPGNDFHDSHKRLAKTYLHHVVVFKEKHHQLLDKSVHFRHLPGTQEIRPHCPLGCHFSHHVWTRTTTSWRKNWNTRK